VETPEPYAPPPGGRRERYADDALDSQPLNLWIIGERLTWIAGLILAVSAFTGWYTGSGEGPTIAVIGWHTGTLGKFVFLIGLAVVALAVLREAGIALPAAVPESLVVIVLGSIATVFVLIRLISIPDRFFPYERGIGIWISLVAAVLVIVAGLLRATDEL
jgi:hypothetical protein